MVLIFHTYYSTVLYSTVLVQYFEYSFNFVIPYTIRYGTVRRFKKNVNVHFIMLTYVLAVHIYMKTSLGTQTEQTLTTISIIILASVLVPYRNLKRDRDTTYVTTE